MVTVREQGLGDFLEKLIPGENGFPIKITACDWITKIS